MVARRTIQDLHLVDEQGRKYVIPKRSSVLVNIQAVHHNPELWPQPLRFNPYRFLQANPIEPYTFIPFIAGPRNCLGQYLALLESKMVISLLVQRYRFSLPNNARKPVTETSSNWETYGSDDPRHRYMVPIVPQDELLVYLSRK
jgi:cytochrome P450